MKTLQLSLLTMLSMLLFACNTADDVVQIATDVVIELAVEPEPPTAGNSTLMITVTDKDGKSIDGAKVVVHGDMDHEGMTPLDSESTMVMEGVYHVPFEWSMGGGWVLDVTVTLPDNAGIVTEQFELFVGAISDESIVNQGETNSADMDHSAMDNMNSEIQIHYMPDSDPSLAGDAMVVVVVTSQDGLPIDDAMIALNADMPAHDMMPISSESKNGVKGRYSIPVRWTMAGDWQVELTVTLSDGQELTQTHTQQVVMPDDTDTEMESMSESEHSGAGS